MTYTVKNVHRYHNNNLKKIEIIVLLLDKKKEVRKRSVIKHGEGIE